MIATRFPHTPDEENLKSFRSLEAKVEGQFIVHPYQKVQQPRLAQVDAITDGGRQPLADGAAQLAAQSYTCCQLNQSSFH